MKRKLLFLITLTLCSTIAWAQISKIDFEQWNQLYKENLFRKHYPENQVSKNRYLDKLLLLIQSNNSLIKNEEEWYEPDTVTMYNPYWKRRDIITYNEHGFKDTVTHQEWWYGMNTELETYARSVYTYNEYNMILSLTGQVLLENETWENYQMFSHTYDINGNSTSYLSQYWNGQSWGNDYRVISKYDNRNNLLTRYLQLWEENDWIYFDNYYTYTYDANNNRLSELAQYWTNSGLKNYKLSTYTYNENNYNDTTLYQIWNSDINEWENKNMYIYKYDNHGNMISSLGQQWINNNWTNNYIITYTYDENNNMLSRTATDNNYHTWRNIWTYDTNNNILSQSKFAFDQTNNVWIKWEQLLCTYNETNSLLSETWQYGSDNEWVNNDQMVYKYDNDNNRISDLYQLWKNNAWQNKNLTEYKYDEHGNCLSGDFWEWKNNEWVTAYSYGLGLTYNYAQCTIWEEYYCHTITASYVKTKKPEIITVIENVEKADINVTVYPNPTTGQLTINNEQLTIENIEIFDLLGRMVFTSPNPSKGGELAPSPLERVGVRFDISHLPQGMYFVRITTDKGTVTRKVVKIK